MYEDYPTLTPEQTAKLHAWERFLRRFYMVGILAILAATLVVYNYRDVETIRRSALIFLAVLLVVAAVIQWRVRCPNCDKRLSFPSRMRFPDFCPSCRYQFPRPPEPPLPPRRRKS